MQKLRIGICEDDQAEQTILLARLENCGIPCETRVFYDGSGLLEDYYPGRYDLLLIDIYMKGLNGVETVSQIRRIDSGVPIAFLTSSWEHAMDGYRFHVERYLVKPYKAADLIEILELAQRNLLNQPRLSLMLSGKRQEILQNTVRFAEQKGHSTYLHLTDGSTIKSTEKLSELAARLPQPPFYICHKSFLVNLIHVRFLNRDLSMFEMAGGGNVYIRRGSLREAESIYRFYMFEQTRMAGEGT
ncbi:MAG: LytTR family DNA-binding domain-containing protein [Oscillospiraceae bacterium]|nr:LytTR family DNA-binding domain-containing protein [Oscillospiraceae bacterium]